MIGMTGDGIGLSWFGVDHILVLPGGVVLTGGTVTVQSVYSIVYRRDIPNQITGTLAALTNITSAKVTLGQVTGANTITIE